MMNKPYTDYQKAAKKRVTLIVASAGTLFSLLIIVLLFAVSEKEAVEVIKSNNDDIVDLLNESDLATGSRSEDKVGIALPQGGWVQQTDELGNLVQQYRCTSLDPNPLNLPDGWIEMDRPEIELYLSDNRLVRITGDHGIANAPKRVLESGEIAGHVIVAMYELTGVSIDSVNANPSMVLTTPSVSFDNFIGEINCESEVRIQTENSTLSGRNLSIRFNDIEGKIEHLQLAELDFIDLYNVERQLPPATTNRRSLASTIQPTPHQTQVKACALPELEHYLITLTENVVITQGDPLDGRQAKGQALTIAFSKNSESTAPSKQVFNPSTSFSSIEAHIASLSLNHVYGVNFDQTVTRITCDAGLTMVPLYDETLFPLTDEDTRLELFGSDNNPVIMRDETQSLTAEGLHFRHEINADRSEITGSPATLTQENHRFVSNKI